MSAKLLQKEDLRPEIFVSISAGLFILAFAARLVPGPRTIDDSYITYRYAMNILSGNGFVYNPGERVLGTTTPLFTILLALVGSFTGGVNAPYPEISMWINAIADGITCLLLFRLGCYFKTTIAGLAAALVWAIAPFSVTFAIGGLETSLYVLLLVSAVYTHLTDRHTLAALFCSLAFLTRPDSLILIGLIFLDRVGKIAAPWLKRQHNPPLQAFFGIIRGLIPESIVFFIPTLPWLIFAWFYFGSPLPHSITAKTLAYQLPQASAFIRLVQHYSTPFMENLTLGIAGIGVGIVLYPFLHLIGALHMTRTNPHSWSLAAYPWFYFLVFSLANPLIFRWYLTPPLPAYTLGILIGAEQLINCILGKIPNPLETKPNGGRLRLAFAPIAAILLITLPTSLSLRGWTIHPDHGVDRPAPTMAWYLLELYYKQAADFVKMDARQNRVETALLAAGDVGVLGYNTGMRILDTVGLNSLIATRYYPLDPACYIINYAVPPHLILDQLPDYLIILEVYGRGCLFNDPGFRLHYRLVRKFSNDIYGSDGLLVFARSQ